MRFLQITVRFLDERYHGLLARNGPPEWPPSPFRLFSAIVAGTAQRNELENGAGDALCWLQELCRDQPPLIIAPRSHTCNTIVRYGPDNDDKFHSEPEKCRSAKPTIPTLMVVDADQDPEVHYLWDIEGITDIPVDRLRDSARNLTRLGWGIDMAFADARSVSLADIHKLRGIRWHPKPGVWREVGMLRVPTADKEVGEDTLSDLNHCHQTALNRLKHGEPRKDVDKPRVFDRVFYASIERPIGRPFVVFELQRDLPFRYPQRKLIHIAGMVRHMAKDAMKHDPPRDVKNAAQWLDRYVAGHARDYPGEHRQFSYIPLPSIGHEHADHAIRRVMITAPVGDQAWLDHLARRLEGQQLKPKHGDEFGKAGPPTLIRINNPLRASVTQHYLKPSRHWASVTPVILPGHDDRKPAKRMKLITKALEQAGIEQPCEFECSPISRYRKAFTAHKYDKAPETGTKRWRFLGMPKYLRNHTWTHLTLRFGEREDPNDPDSRWIPAAQPIPGPLAIGAGRHCGFGIFAKYCPELNPPTNPTDL